MSDNMSLALRTFGQRYVRRNVSICLRRFAGRCARRYVRINAGQYGRVQVTMNAPVVSMLVRIVVFAQKKNGLVPGQGWGF